LKFKIDQALRKIIEAMGGELEIRAILPSGIVRLSQFGELRKPPHS